MKFFIIIALIFVQWFELSAQGNSENLIKVHKNTKNSINNFQEDTLKAKFLYNLSFDYYLKKELSDSIIYTGNIVEKLATRYHWQEGYYLCNFLKGTGHKSKGEFVDASNYYFKALSIAEKTNNSTQIGNSVLELGNCYYLLKQNKIANLYYNRAIDIFKKSNTLYKLAQSYNGIALSYRDLADYEKSLIYFDRAKKIFEQLKLDWAIANIFENIGLVYMDKELYSEAEDYLRTSLGMFLKINRQFFISHNYSKLGELYFKMGKYQKSIENSKKSIEIAERHHQERLLLDSYESLYKCYKVLENDSKALQYYEKLFKQKELQIEQDSKRQIVAMRFEYDNIKQKEKNELQKKELEYQKRELEYQRSINLYLWSGVIGFILFVLFLFYLNNKLSQQKRKIENQKNEIAKAQQKLEELNRNLEERVEKRTAQLKEANEELIRKNQEISQALFKGQTIERKRIATELHDNLGGHISAIRWSLMAIDILKLNQKEISIYEGVMRMINEAYNEVRYISHNLMPDEFSRYGLVAGLNNLITQLNQNKTIVFFLDTDTYEKVEERIEFEVYSIILELINNIMKYSGAMSVWININKKPETLSIKIVNNGKYFDPTNFSDSSGRGIKNINERVDAINGEMKFTKLLNLNVIEVQITA